MATKKNRIMISLSDDILEKLEKVSNKHGLSKSVIIHSLILKYLEIEYGKIDAEKGKMLWQE